MSVRKLILSAAVGLMVLVLLPVLVTVVGQFFVELAKEQGHLTNPTAKVTAIVAFVDSILANRLFQWFSFAIGGFTAGVWLDYFLRRWGGFSKVGKFTPEQISDLLQQIAVTRSIIDASGDNVTYEGFHEATALSIKLGRLGIPMPLLPKYREQLQYESFNDKFSKFLGAITPHIRDGDIRQTKVFAEAVADIIFRNSDEADDEGENR